LMRGMVKKRQNIRKYMVVLEFPLEGSIDLLALGKSSNSHATIRTH